MDFSVEQPLNMTVVYVVIVLYFVIVLGFGGIFGRFTKTTRDFFVSGQRFSWWLVAFSCVVTVVGSYSFIKYSAAGYRYGLSSSMTYLNDWFLIPLFVLGWMPLIYYSRVTSIPEYLEKRFNTPTRVAAVVFIMLYMIGYIGINLYTLGVAMNAIAPLHNFLAGFVPEAQHMQGEWIASSPAITVLAGTLPKGAVIQGTGNMPDVTMMAGMLPEGFYTQGVSNLTYLSRFSWALIIAVIAAVYVTFGGQTAIIMTDLLQGVLLLVAGLALFVLGIHFLGIKVDGMSGLAAFWEGLNTGEGHQYPFSGFAHPNKFPMTGIFWQDFFGSSMFFYFANQGLIMRFLAVKSVNEGRKAITAVVLILMPLAAIAVANAGWLGRAMDTFGILGNVKDANDIFVIVSGMIVKNPVIFGLILAALTAALMSTVDTLINAVSAIAVTDVWKPYVMPGRSDKHYLFVARVASVIFAIGGLALVPVYMRFKSIYVAHGAFTAAISPPIIVVIVFAVVWKRFSAMAAFLTLVLGGALMFVSLMFPDSIKPLAYIHGMDPGTGYNYMRALYGFILCSIIAVVFSYLWPVLSKICYSRRDAKLSVRTFWWLFIVKFVVWFDKLVPSKDDESIKGFWVGTIQAAKFMFKGRAPNEEPGEKVRLTLEAGKEAMEDDSGALLAALVEVSADDADRMKAQEGDLLYVCDKRWWLGGLRSLHARLSIIDRDQGTIKIPKDYIDYGRLRIGEEVVVEKII